MVTDDKDVHDTKQEELVEDPKEKADSSALKQQSKKKKTGNTRRRTKTGCLTCRQRRVKCDETKPTCRNCDKSRRQCAGYQPAPVQRQQGSAPTQGDPTFYQYQTPPGMHVQFSPSSPQQSLEGISPPFSQAQQQTSFTTTHSMAYNHAEREWQYQNECNFVDDAVRWSPGQGSWVSALMPSSQPPMYGMHAVATPAMHATVYSLYPGRQTPQPPSLDTSHQQNDAMSRSTSSLSLQRGHSATYTDLGKFSSRGERSELASATSSQPSLLNNSDSTTRRGYFDHKLASTRVRYLSEDEQEDPTDPYDIDTDDDTNDHGALVNFRSTRNLILDERMAYLLRHFCNILRPCISIFERPVVHNGSSTFAEKLPRLALSDRGLLHGIMAVSALHLAVLHRTSEVVPLKHFVIASRKLNKLLAAPGKRHKVETLSLCLLLAFYSVMLGDHAKWMMHLKGCSAFLMEHDFAGMASRMRQLKATGKRNARDPRSEHQSNTWSGRAAVAEPPSTLLLDQDWQVDDALISKLTGFDIDYATQVQPSNEGGKSQKSLTSHEIDIWKTKTDLLFWYIKMDIFQSTLSGDRLLLPYSKWKYFPPRGKIGSVKSVFATMDHLWLVLGRLADFGAKDRVRKQSKIAASGGHWMPDPEYFAPPQGSAKAERKSNKDRETSDSQIPHLPSANEGRTRAPKASSNPPRSKRGPPMFYGMMPPPKIPPSMLSEFHIMDTELRRRNTSDVPKATKSEDVDLEEQTQLALAEHKAIGEALEMWKEALSQDFDAHQSLPIHTNTPFTPIQRYSDPTIACMWAFYYFGRILLRRYHPASPPAMMMSAAVNAPFTKQDSQMIGRINAGLLEAQAELATAGSMNPTLVAALQEVTFPLMFAGIQYQDAAQRSWTIDNLLDVARDSGWKSAFSVASAMETAWTAQGGYERTLGRRNPHDARKYDADLSTSGDLGMTPEEQHESRFDSHDRRLIDRFSDLRAYWAIGVLSTSDDVEKMISQMHISPNPRR